MWEMSWNGEKAGLHNATWHLKKAEDVTREKLVIFKVFYLMLIFQYIRKFVGASEQNTSFHLVFIITIMELLALAQHINVCLFICLQQGLAI